MTSAPASCSSPPTGSSTAASAPPTRPSPPNPINPYGFLKAASELVVTQRAARGTVARLAGVQGVHRARPQTPRHQDAGFGYLVGPRVGAQLPDLDTTLARLRHDIEHMNAWSPA